ncbi:hypothetical protein [Deinococcus petrolearius]|uniref:Uncharacterized protein n=1 Tax=Deinococcus petrolearius TaxID=1751295 RepID=A0ABW1DJY1_9DEIO
MTKIARLFAVLTAASLTLAPVALAQSPALPTPLLTSDTAQLEVFAQTPAVAVVTYYSAAPGKDAQILGETTLNWRSNAARTAEIQAKAPAGTQYVRIYTNAQATVLPYNASFSGQVDTLASRGGGVMPVQALD